MYKQEFEDVDGDTVDLQVIGWGRRYVEITEGNDSILIGVASIDKLIAALQKIQGEIT